MTSLFLMISGYFCCHLILNKENCRYASWRLISLLVIFLYTTQNRRWVDRVYTEPTNASNSASRRHLITVSISNLQSFVGGLWLGLDVTLASEARITHHFFFKKLASQTSFGPWIIWFMLDLACNALNPVSVERHKKEKSTRLLLYSSLSINFWRKWSLFRMDKKGVCGDWMPRHFSTLFLLYHCRLPTITCCQWAFPSLCHLINFIIVW
jgi:hypothetical protein